jgi:thymidylate synthase (FAD)
MEVRLLFYSTDGIYSAIQVCQNTDNSLPAVLDKALAAGHTSLLEHMVYTFEINGISRACSHQLVRHRIASYAQESQRYVKIKDEDWYIVPDRVKDFKAFHSLMEILKASYNQMLANGTPLEDARYILPNCTKTNLIMTINGRSLDNFLTLRTCSHAQWEIRELANKMLQKVRVVSPYFNTVTYPKCGECKNPCNKKGE